MSTLGVKMSHLPYFWHIGLEFFIKKIAYVNVN